MERGNLVQLFGPGVWAGRSRARAKGHRNGAPSGDIWRLPGVLLVDRARVVWSHEYRHAADHPDYETICEVAAAAA